MAGVVEPSREPQFQTSRRTSQARNQVQRPPEWRVDSEEEKVLKTTQVDPKTREAESKACYPRRRQAAPPAPHAGPWGAAPVCNRRHPCPSSLTR